MNFKKCLSECCPCQRNIISISFIILPYGLFADVLNDVSSSILWKKLPLVPH